MTTHTPKKITLLETQDVRAGTHAAHTKRLGTDDTQATLRAPQVRVHPMVGYRSVPSKPNPRTYALKSHGTLHPAMLDTALLLRYTTLAPPKE